MRNTCAAFLAVIEDLGVYTPKNNQVNKRNSPMSLDKKAVAKVASLARLKVSDEDLEKYGPQLTNIISFVEQLSEVDTDNVEPLANVVDITLRLREDEITDGNVQKDVLANAPETLEGFFVVPKVVE